MFIESEEESGSKYLDYYLGVLANEKKLHPSFVAILDSGGNDHDHCMSAGGGGGKEWKNKSSVGSKCSSLL